MSIGSWAAQHAGRDLGDLRDGVAPAPGDGGDRPSTSSVRPQRRAAATRLAAIGRVAWALYAAGWASAGCCCGRPGRCRRRRRTGRPSPSSCRRATRRQRCPTCSRPCVAQLRPGDELVVVDDHSTDGTAAVAAASRRDGRRRADAARRAGSASRTPAGSVQRATTAPTARVPRRRRAARAATCSTGWPRRRPTPDAVVVGAAVARRRAPGERATRWPTSSTLMGSGGVHRARRAAAPTWRSAGAGGRPCRPTTAPAATPTRTCAPASPRTSRSPAASAAAGCSPTARRHVPHVPVGLRPVARRVVADDGRRHRADPLVARARRRGWVWSLAGGPVRRLAGLPAERRAGVGARPPGRARRAGRSPRCYPLLVRRARRHRRRRAAWNRVRGTTTWKGRAGHGASVTSSRILPTLASASMCAVGLGDVVEREAAVDHRAQRAGGEQRQHLVGEAPADRDLLLERPRRAARCRSSATRLASSRPTLTVGRAAAHQADLDDRALRPDGARGCGRPPRRRSRRARRRRRRARPCSASPARSAAGQSAGERSSTRSAPSSRQASALPAEHVTATRAPIALAIWIAAVPTPDAPAWTSAQRPLVSPPCTTSASHAVRNTSGTAAASARSSPAGTGSAWRAWVTTCSA